MIQLNIYGRIESISINWYGNESPRNDASDDHGCEASNDSSELKGDAWLHPNQQTK
jgi:hypothetical protein